MCPAKPVKNAASASQDMQGSLLSVLQSLLAEQRQTNQLLIMLVETLAEDQGNDDQERTTYLDGSTL